jgi:tetratricopeptide (TPR) repeat protein
VAVVAGDQAASLAWGEEALSLHRALGNIWDVAYVQMGLGVTFASEDRFTEAKQPLEEGIRGFRELGDQHWEMQTSRRLAWSLEELGDIAGACEIHEDNLRRARDLGDVFIEARTLAVLASLHLDEGQVESAIPLLAESQRLRRGRTAIPDRYNSVINVCGFARAPGAEGGGRGRHQTALERRSRIRGARGSGDRGMDRPNERRNARGGERFDRRGGGGTRSRGGPEADDRSGRHAGVEHTFAVGRRLARVPVT